LLEVQSLFQIYFSTMYNNETDALDQFLCFLYFVSCLVLLVIVQYFFVLEVEDY